MRHKIYRRAAAIFVVLLVFAQMVQVSWSYHEEQRQAALTGQEAEPEKLTLWYTDEKLNPYLVEAAEEFEQQNHVEITLQLVTAVDYIEHINTASISDLGGPDLFITSSELLEKARLAGLTVENDSLKNDGVDISILSVRQEDVAGTLSPYADNRIFVALNGPARVLSFENGNPVDTERNFAASSRRCFFGLNRLFIQSVEAAEAPVSVLLSAICGDRQLQQSSEVSIVTTEVVLRSDRPQRHLRIRYTTDGTFPTPASFRYEGPFRVVEGTEVRAAVYDGTRCLQQLSERFGREEGLFWPAAAKE